MRFWHFAISVVAISEVDRSMNRQGNRDINNMITSFGLIATIVSMCKELHNLYQQRQGELNVRAQGIPAIRPTIIGGETAGANVDVVGFPVDGNINLASESVAQGVPTNSDMVASGAPVGNATNAQPPGSQIRSPIPVPTNYGGGVVISL